MSEDIIPHITLFEENKPMEFMLITPVPEVASFLEGHGVNRIMIDMETLGKAERQAGAMTPINSHTFDDARRVRSVLKKSELMIRINPLSPLTASEVDRSIDAGADIVMLPYFKEVREVEEFMNIVRGRIKVNLLFETASAVARAEQIFRLGGFDEVHFGLNDLRLTLGCDFLFEPLAGGLVEWLCFQAKNANISYGIGGIGRVGKELIPAEIIMNEYVRLGSERVILSRVFHGEAKTVEELNNYCDFGAELSKLKAVEFEARGRDQSKILSDHLAFVASVTEVADLIRKKRAA